MKKYINYTVMLIALLAMGFTFTSCEDDNNNGSGDTVNLNGTWYLDYYVYENSGNRVKCTWGEYMYFNNGALIWNNRKDEDYSGYVYTQNGNNVTCTNVLNPSEVENWTVSISGSNLIIKNPKNTLTRYLHK